MGYTAHVTEGLSCILDLKLPLEKTKGKNIKIGFNPNIPGEEKIYELNDVNVGNAVNGAYIHFYLKENNSIIEFVISGIKEYEFDIHENFRKYWVSTSEDLLTAPEQSLDGVTLQNEDKTYRFFLYISEHE